MVIGLEVKNRTSKKKGAQVSGCNYNGTKGEIQEAKVRSRLPAFETQELNMVH